MERSLVNKMSTAFSGWMKYHFQTRKMSTPLGIALLGLAAVLMTYTTVFINEKLSIGLVGFLGVLLIGVICVLYPFFGFYFSYFISMFIVLPERLLNGGVMPTGLIPEFFSYLALVGVVTKYEYRSEIVHRRFWSHAITIWLVVFLAYYIIELFNPLMGNKFAWFNYFRKQVSYFAFFYVSFALLNSRKRIWHFTYFWIIISTFEALYACKQQWIGFFGFEYNWLIADEKRYNLFVNWGFMRKFGLLSDPAASGILYSAAGVFILVLALRTKKTREKILFSAAGVINLLASTYTGTRTATLMIVAGVAFYCIMTLYEKRTIIFSAFFALLFAAIMVAPIYNNVIINRVRSTFEASTDPSALVRDLNRHAVQPYVYRHPIGGGIYTCGNLGEIYNPGHYLSQFPPDSGYMQIMMEMGYIGLILTLMMYYRILRTGIHNFYKVQDEDIKTLYVANLVFIFTMLVAMFSQQAIGQYPSVFYYLSALALMIKLQYYDSSYTNALNAQI